MTNKPPIGSARQLAIAAGERTYSTGRPCSRGHLAARYTLTSNCTECARERREAVRQAIKQR